MEGTPLKIIIFYSILITIACLFFKPRILMVFVLLFVYILPRAGFFLVTPWYRFPLPLGYIVISSITLRWFFYRTFTRTREKTINPIKKPFLLYIAITILAIMIGISRGGHKPTMILEVLFYFVAFFTFFVVMDIFGKRDCARLFMDGILYCGFLVSLYGILLLFYGKSLLVSYITYNAATYAALEGQFLYAKRTLSTYGDPNVLNSQLMVFCGIFTSLLLQGRHRPLKKIFLFFSLLLTLVCIYFASSRASLIGLFVLWIVFAMTKIKKMWLYIPILVTGYLMFLEPIRKYYEHRIFTIGIASDLRITYIKTFFEMVARFPFGVGFGNSIDENFFVVPAYSVWTGFNSFYLHFFSRLGIQGLVIFTVMLYMILRYLFNEMLHVEDPNVKFFIFGAGWGIIVQQLNFITNNTYHVPGGMLNFWIMCGMLTTIVNLYKKPLQKR